MGSVCGRFAGLYAVRWFVRCGARKAADHARIPRSHIPHAALAPPRRALLVVGLGRRHRPRPASDCALFKSRRVALATMLSLLFPV